MNRRILLIERHKWKIKGKRGLETNLMEGVREDVRCLVLIKVSFDASAIDR